MKNRLWPLIKSALSLIVQMKRYYMLSLRFPWKNKLWSLLELTLFSSHEGP